jgi:hypothetical protein
MKRLPAFLAAWAAVLLLAAARPSFAQQAQSHAGEGGDIVPDRDIPAGIQKPQPPKPYLRWMLRPLKRGMLVRLPIIDTDPNRGVTVGVMPIWVIKEEGGERIKQIHAPSVTYNHNFQVTPTYRYYLYPSDDATIMARGSVGKYEHEGMAHYEDRSFAKTPWDVVARVQYNVDAGGHFYGLGPDSQKRDETNFKADYLLMRLGAGLPFWRDSGWRVHLENRMLSQKVTNGPLSGLKGFEATFPGFITATHHQSNELRAIVDYDTRDNPVTTTQGVFFQVYEEHAFRDFLSEYDFSRTGLDTRYFYRWPTEKKRVTAVNVRFEQLGNTAPFWLLPSLGGKYSLRAYGEGRYVDRSVVTVNLEQRFTFYDTHMGGVTTEFELAPFVGFGEVADSPGRYAARYTRPVLGGAIRAVARPQVVGSVDFGVGQEGLSVFTDINYSF